MTETQSTTQAHWFMYHTHCKKLDAFVRCDTVYMFGVNCILVQRIEELNAYVLIKYKSEKGN